MNPPETSDEEEVSFEAILNQELNVLVENKSEEEELSDQETITSNTSEDEPLIEIASSSARQSDLRISKQSGTTSKENEIVCFTSSSDLIKINELPPTVANEESDDDSENEINIKPSLTRKIMQNWTKKLDIFLEPAPQNIPKTPPCVKIPQFVERRDVTYEIVRNMSEELVVIVDPNSPQVADDVDGECKGIKKEDYCDSEEVCSDVEVDLEMKGLRKDEEEVCIICV